MKGIAFWFLLVASLFATAGMIWGIQMSMTQDHAMAGAHAHNNLIGWVTMAIYGLYYAAVPAAGQSRLALVHFWVAFVGALAFVIGLAMVLSGGSPLLVSIASFVVLLGMVIFVYTIFANRSALSGD